MKKLALIVCVLMLFSVVACARDNGKVGDNTKNGNVVDKAEDKAEDIIENNKNVNNGTGTNKGTVTTGEEQTLKGTAKGYGGDVNVTVKVKGNDITSVEAVGDKETKGVGSNAIDQLPDKIEDADSTDVEGVSGATVTSNAIKEAVNKALDTRK